MKRMMTLLRGVAVILLLTIATAQQTWAANKKEAVEQVTSLVVLDSDVDYSVTSETPFGDNGMVNITNTDHAVLILSSVKPSAAVKLLANHVQINGAKAVQNSNCQVKLYNLGCIILPYGENTKPLTVYSEPQFGGQAVNDFGLENDNGYMNTLTEKKLNNRIRSFKLKRGYMVTFSTRAGGRGYSRCFIAADQDIEMATLPGILDRSITSYRIFKWYDAGKKQLANDLNTTTLAALNVQSSYTWSEGHNMAPDYECVPNHIYEDYPSSAAIGRATWSPHSKNNNEPRNSSDDHPQDLTTILNNWENMMRTGMRLCSPASWDGSDYWNATGFLADFLDEIDARGWRCDIIDLHCYWAEGSFPNIANWANKYKRPVWISEWCWGASWNKNGAFAEGVTQANVRDALERICTNLNKWDYVERYYYWNGEATISRLYTGGALTPAGKYYAAMNSGIGYNGKYNYAPTIPEQGDPGALSISFDKKTKVATLSWSEPNGEMNTSMTVEYRQGDGYSWKTAAEMTLKEGAADYVYNDSAAISGYQYRIHVIDANNKDRYTKAVMAASDDMTVGDIIPVEGQNMYLGGNILVNGDFDMDTYGWTDGTGSALAKNLFQVIAIGGNDGGSYLQSYGNGGANSEASVKTVFDIVPSSTYYFSGASCNCSGTQNQISLSSDGVKTEETGAFLYNVTNTWTTKFTIFQSKDYPKAIATFRLLGGKTQFDQLMLCQLFNTKEEAVADGVAKAKDKATAFAGFNTRYPTLNNDLEAQMTVITGTDEDALVHAERAMENALKAYYAMGRIDSMLAVVNIIDTIDMPGKTQLAAAVETATTAKTALDIMEAEHELEQALQSYMPLDPLATNPIKQPLFAKSDGWTTKCGTYTEGDQRVNSQDDVTFWNAWWSGLSASEGTNKTMEVKQTVTGLTHGLYAVQCKATTEHNCLSDQHAYITDGTLTAVTPKLSADYFDLPTIDVTNRWQTLTSTPIYVPDGGSVTIGFVGSKQGATDNLWHRIGEPTSNGDKREGWWCATDFKLMCCPMYKTTVVPQQWGVICLPYAIKASDDIKLYEIAAINSDYTRLCLREISETTAGMACIYWAEKADATFYEFGDMVKSTKDAPGNLRGFLKTSARVPTGYYALQNGEWNKVGTDRPTMTNYTGIIRPFTDSNSKQVPVVDNWDGPTMAINGVTEEEMAAGINLPVAQMQRHDGLYTIDGRSMRSSHVKPGLYIKVVNGKAYKTIVK